MQNVTKGYARTNMFGVDLITALSTNAQEHLIPNTTQPALPPHTYVFKVGHWRQLTPQTNGQWAYRARPKPGRGHQVKIALLYIITVFTGRVSTYAVIASWFDNASRLRMWARNENLKGARAQTKNMCGRGASLGRDCISKKHLRAHTSAVHNVAVDKLFHNIFVIAKIGIRW